MARVLAAIAKFIKDQASPTSIEYAIMAALVAAVVVGAAAVLGINTDALLQNALKGLGGG